MTLSRNDRAPVPSLVIVALLRPYLANRDRILPIEFPRSYDNINWKPSTAMPPVPGPLEPK